MYKPRNSRKPLKSYPNKNQPPQKETSQDNLDVRISKFLKRFETNSLPQYGPLYVLFDLFILSQWKNLIKKLGVMEEEERKTTALQMQLENLFLKKYHLDPGFRLFLLLKMGEKPETLRKIQRELLPFLSDPQSFKPVQALPKEMEEKFNLYKMEKVIENTLHHWGPNFFFSTALIRDSKKERYLFQLWQDSLKAGIPEDIITTEALLQELIMGDYFGSNLFQDLTFQKVPGNSYFYFMESTRKIVEKLDFRFLDYLESQQRNRLLFVEVQKIIDSFNYQNLMPIVNELLAHVKDLLQGEDPLVQFRLKGDLIKIMALIYFENLNIEKKYSFLNKFFGLDFVFAQLECNPVLYPFQKIIPDFPTWASLDLLPEINIILDKQLRQNTGILNDNQELIVVKYKCKGFLERNQAKDAIVYLKGRYPIINEWENLQSSAHKPQCTSRLDLELLNLLGEIYCAIEDDSKINILKTIYSDLIKQAADDQTRVKLSVLLAVLFRRRKDFIQESWTLQDIQPEIQKLQQSKTMNPFEVLFSLVPLKMTLSENRDPNQINAHLWKLSTLEFLEFEPNIPFSWEIYCIYGDLRSKIVRGNPPVMVFEYEEMERRYQQAFGNSVAYQSMGSFERAIKGSKKAEQQSRLLHLEKKEKGLLYEACIFPRLYLDDFEGVIDFIQKAINNDPLDSYFYPYLFLSHFVQGNFKQAREVLSKLYNYESTGEQGIFLQIKKCYQNLMICYKQDKFPEIIHTLIGNSGDPQTAQDRYAKELCDVGIAIADLGYSEEALKYLVESAGLMANINFKAQILNDIGTVYSDQQAIEKAISMFDEATRLHPQNLTAWMNLAKMYTFQSNYLQVKKVLEAAKQRFLDIDKAAVMAIDLKIFEAEIGEKSNINLTLVKDQTVLYHLRYALQSIRNINVNPESRDYTGPIFSAFANAYTRYFEKKLGSQLLEYLDRKYGVHVQIPVPEWKRLPPGLRELRKGKSIGVGQIAHLMESLARPGPDLLLQELAHQLPPSLTEKDIMSLGMLGSKLQSLRNRASHGDVLDWDTFKKNIDAVVLLLNEMIDIFSRI